MSSGGGNGGGGMDGRMDGGGDGGKDGGKGINGGGTFRYGIYFLIFVMSLYAILFLTDSGKIYRALRMSLDIFIQILPVLVLVILLMWISSYFLKPKTVSKYLGGESGIKGWILAASFGIVSHGSIYVWYPLLKEMRGHGMRDGLIAVFLYNRAVKIPLIPVMVYYFGAVFVSVLTVYTVIASLIEGKLVEMLEH